MAQPKSRSENPHVYFDIQIGNKKAGRIVMEVRVSYSSCRSHML